MMQVLESQQLSELIGLITLTHWMPQYFQNMICVSEIQNDLLYDKGLQSTNECNVRLHLAKIFKLHGYLSDNYLNNI